MTFKILQDNGTITTYDTKIKETNEDDIVFISSSSKEENGLKLLKTYQNNQKTILYDKTNKLLEQKIQNLNLQEFLSKDFIQLFFTSGTTGEPIGALKTKKNLDDEVKVFSTLVGSYNIKKVIVTVPFVHIYGTLVGLLYPLLNDIDIVLKEHFLPFDLIDICNENTLVVTTPLYINALNKIKSKKDLNGCLFVSSTAPLDSKIAKEFITKFNTNILQLFGSTETGGIAYKYNDEQLWTPFENVDISQNTQGELKIQSPFVSNILFDGKFKVTNGFIQTFDYVQIIDNKFKLIGRSSKIFKVAGKRYSTVQIEDILENIEEINKAIVFVNYDTNTDERLNITLESKKEFSSKEIKKILKSNMSNLKFNLDLRYVDKIPVNSIGKKYFSR